MAWTYLKPLFNHNWLCNLASHSPVCTQMRMAVKLPCKAQLKFSLLLKNQKSEVPVNSALYLLRTNDCTFVPNCAFNWCDFMSGNHQTHRDVILYCSRLQFFPPVGRERLRKVAILASLPQVKLIQCNQWEPVNRGRNRGSLSHISFFKPLPQQLWFFCCSVSWFVMFDGAFFFGLIFD